MTKFIDAGSSGEWGWHATEIALRCPRLFAYQYRMPKSAEEGDRPALLKGSLIHQGLAHHYARRRSAEVGTDPAEWATPDAAIEDCAAKLGRHAAQYVDLAKRVVAQYAANWAYEKLEVLHVEDVFRAEIEGFRFTQRFDLVVRENDGKVWIFDHKCLPASARVFTNRGPMTVGELVDQGAPWTAAAIENGDSIVWSAATTPVDAGIQDVWEIKTSGGQVGRFGYRHPIWTRRGWVQAADLRPGDAVAAAIRLPALPEVSVPDALLWVLGSLICDGGLKTNSPTYTKQSAEKRTRFLAALRALDAVPELDFKEHFPIDKTPYIQLRARSSAVSMLRQFGLLGVGSADKRIPTLLLSLSPRQTGILLGALWSGDGSATVGKNGNTRLVYASRSKQLCADVKELLTRVGVGSTVTTGSVLYRGSRRPYHYTTIVGESKERFLRLVESGAISLIGIELAPLFAASGQRRRYEHQNDIMWDRVESALCIGRERCYDIEVPEKHTFVAEGFVTHNTTGRLGSTVAERYTLSGQFLGMANFGRMVWGDEFGGVKLNLIEIGDDKPCRFSRKTPDPAPAALKSFPLTVLHARQRIHALDSSGLAPMDWPMALSEQTCITAYGRCDFFDRCRFGP